MNSIGGYEISSVRRSQVDVGCQTIKREDIEKLLEMMDEVKPKAFPVMECDNEDVHQCLEAVRAVSHVSSDFMQRRVYGVYEDCGFYLGDMYTSKWKVVIDNTGSQVLILEDDEIV